MTALYASPPLVVLVVAAGVAVLLACAGHVAVRRAFPRTDFRAHNDVGGIVLGVTGGLFAVMLAFIVAIVWQEFDASSQRVAVEAAAATDLWHTARGLPAPLGPSVRSSLAEYASLMVHDEWPAMRTGGSSKRAEDVLTRTFEGVAQFRPRDAGASNAQSASLQYLGTLHDARHHRLDDNNSGVSPFEWIILLIGAVVVIGTCYLVGLSSLRTQLLMTGAVAAMIAATFVLIFELDYPFRGELSIAPVGWQEFLDRNRYRLRMPHAHDALACRCPRGPFHPDVFACASALLGRRSFLAGLGASFAAALWPSGARAADAVTLLRAARLFDGTAMRAPGVLVLRGDRIVSLNAGDAGSGATAIDLGDATLMPGLIDAHTHVAASTVVSSYLIRSERSADSIAEAALLSIRNAQSMLANGFTTIRDVGGGAGIDLALRNVIARGGITGPRILASGPILSITGGHGDQNDLPPYVSVEQGIESGISFGPYGFRQRVREHVKRHVDLIKIVATGGVLSYGDAFDVPQFNLDEVQATVDEATKFGLHVAAHAHGDRGIRVAVDGGVHSVEHGTGVGDATLRAMKDRGTALVPTIWALDSILQPGNPNQIPANGLEKAHQAAVLRNEGMQRALAAGAKIVYGTDAGVFPHAQNNKDFALLQTMGMHALDLLRSATSHAADMIGTKDRGRLAPGLLADVVAFNGDPSTNAALLEKAPVLLVVGGKRVDRGSLRT